ncbi:MAG TPA: hypothetical protein DCS43_08710 [Verrucomicrobia bacterium]|nr:hypothetical protein [Verrucomicrobiota bacterium]
MQYALLVAGQADERHERTLSPIHLIKYLYLVDLDHSRFHDGQTFTGLDWKFHHFGPWSTVAYQQIDPALSALGARKSKTQSQYGEQDWVRWSFSAERDQVDHVGQGLPLEIRKAIEHYVGKYHNNTTAMLHDIYATPPMLKAAPGEELDFSVMIKPPIQRPSKPYIPYLDRLSAAQRTALKKKIMVMRERFGDRMAKSGRTVRTESGNYDAVYEDGVKWLDSLAGEPFPEGEVTVHFADDVWKSSARSGDD